MSEPVSSDAPLFHAATYTDPQQVLETVFGYRDFRPGQRRIIDAVLAGRDCIGVMPTGAGKSLTFQLPAKLLPGAVLVISPLISLMKDQVDALTRLGFRAAVINSSIEFEERRRPTVLHDRTGGRAHDPGDAFQEGGLPGSVVTEQPERLAVFDVNRHVSERPELFVAGLAEVDHSLFQRVRAGMIELEVLRDVIDRDRRTHLPGPH